MQINDLEDGGRDRDRTCDPYDVNVDDTAENGAKPPFIGADVHVTPRTFRANLPRNCRAAFYPTAPAEVRP